MRRIGLAVFCAMLLGFAAVASPVRGQSGGPPPPPPPPGGGTIGPPCPPAGCPTNTPTATPPATSTPQPTNTPTATPIPCFATVKLGHKSVKVGKKQSVKISTLPSASVKVTVKFPNNSKKTKTGAASASGTFSWSFKQAANKTTAKSRTASVTTNVTCGAQTPVKSSKKYKIG